MTNKFQFLCGNFNNKKLIYATKFGKHAWHFFDEIHRTITEHELLPSKLEVVIAKFKRAQSIEILLTDEQVKLYYNNEKFIFKNTELKTYIQLDNKSPVNLQAKRHGEKTKQINFIPGETDPLRFLDQFEKCEDMKTDRDKLWRIRHFVNENDKGEFSKLRFTSDWATAKRAFVEKYSMPFIEKKKKEINIEFNKEPDLRSFVNRKFLGLATDTTLPFINQIEIVLNELPEQVAYILMEVVDMYNEDHQIERVPSIDIEEGELHRQTDDINYPACSALTLQEPSSSTRRGRGKRVSTSRDEGSRRKRNLTSIPEENSCGETSDCTFLNEMSNSSNSTWSSCSGSLSTRSLRN